MRGSPARCALRWSRQPGRLRLYLNLNPHSSSRRLVSVQPTTLLLLDTGFFNVYGPDGKTPDSKAIARDSGQVRLGLLVDQNGTPNDPFDDEVIGEELLVKVTGRTDDICAAEVPLLVG